MISPNPKKRPLLYTNEELEAINKDLKEEINTFKEREANLELELEKITFNKHSIEKRLEYHIYQLKLQKEISKGLITGMEDYRLAASKHIKSPVEQILKNTKLLKIELGGNSFRGEQKTISDITNSALQLNDLFSDLLLYLNISNQELQDFSDLLPEEVLEVIKQELKRDIEATGATLTIKELPMIRANPYQFHLLFKELILNAIKFRRPQPPEIIIEALYKDNSHVFSIKDNGIGLIEDNENQIFSLFGRLPTSNTIEGTGLGLALARKILDNHNGNIWYHSNQEFGTTFSFSIPDRYLM